MATISSKFFVQVIEDGTTLHGEMRATKSLTQAYKNPGCIPDWTVAGNQPTVYVTLQNGAAFTVPDATGTWYYNGNALTWTNNLNDEITGILPAGTFERLTAYTPPTGYSAGEYVPAIRIRKNLASSTNVDIDVIRYDGQKTLTTNPVTFSASLNVTITEWTEGGYIGVIDYLNGICDLDNTNTQVTCQAHLYDGDGNQVLSGVTYKWFFEGDASGATPRGTASSFVVSAADVVDYVMVRCEFYVTVDGVPTRVYTAYAGVDDTSDPEYIWITYNGQTGNSASLREGQQVDYKAWVGKADDPTYRDTRFTSFKVKLTDSTGSVITTTGLDGFADPDANGYRTLTFNPTTHEASWYVTYAVVYNAARKGLFGVVIASTAS